MRNSYSRSRSSDMQIPWVWIAVVAGILLLVFLIRSLFGGSTPAANANYLTVTPLDLASQVYISMSNTSKKQIKWAEKLYTTDYSVSVDSGGAAAVDSTVSVDLDAHSELGYQSHSQTGDVLRLDRGRAWIDTVTVDTTVVLKNFQAKVQPGEVALFEQNNQIYSTAYALQGDLVINTSIGQYTLPAGKRIMISASDLANPGASLSALAGEIDDSIAQSPLFIRNDGSSLISSRSNSGSTSSGALLSMSGSSGSILTASSGKIQITQPTDGSLVPTKTVTVTGNITSTDVKRVTINDVDAVVNLENGTFILQDVALNGQINNLIYKAYDANNILIDKWLITVYGSKDALAGSNRLIPTTFPLSSKDFAITYPGTNPYVTHDSYVKVQGTVPRNTVQYIVVNDYRLQKFVANSTTWYYYANKDTETMQEGINLYKIKFYGPSNELLYTQLFTIVKESSNAVSGESSR